MAVKPKCKYGTEQTSIHQKLASEGARTWKLAMYIEVISMCKIPCHLVALTYAFFHYLLLAVSSNDGPLPLRQARRRPLRTGVRSRAMFLAVARLSVPTLTQTLVELLPRE